MKNIPIHKHILIFGSYNAFEEDMWGVSMEPDMLLQKLEEADITAFSNGDISSALSTGLQSSAVLKSEGGVPENISVIESLAGALGTEVPSHDDALNVNEAPNISVVENNIPGLG